MTANILPALQAMAVPIETLHPFEGNPHRGDVDSIARSLAQLGQHRPVVVDAEGRVIVGNHTLLAARQLGWTEIAAIVTDDDDVTAQARLLADNRTSELGTNDDSDLLAMLLRVTSADTELLAAASYGQEDILALLAAQPPPFSISEAYSDPDEVPEPPPVPISKRGDVWLLGPHRVMCGDATMREDYERVLGGEHLSGAVVADPPYGVGIGQKNRDLDSIDRAGQVLTDLEGDQGIEEVEKLWRESFAVLFDVIEPGSPYYIFGPQGGDLGLLLLLLRDSGLAPRHILIWAKNRASFSIGRLDYDYQHEPIVYGWRPGAAHPWHAAETQTSILTFDRSAASRLHPTMKPTDLLGHLIVNSTPFGGQVLDPFGGSGSTLIACHQTGRVARLLEIDPHYTDVICRRFQAFTGTVPILESTGEAVSFVAPLANL